MSLLYIVLALLCVAAVIYLLTKKTSRRPQEGEIKTTHIVPPTQPKRQHRSANELDVSTNKAPEPPLRYRNRL